MLFFLLLLVVLQDNCHLVVLQDNCHLQWLAKKKIAIYSAVHPEWDLAVYFPPFNIDLKSYYYFFGPIQKVIQIDENSSAKKRSEIKKDRKTRTQKGFSWVWPKKKNQVKPKSQREKERKKEIGGWIHSRMITY